MTIRFTCGECSSVLKINDDLAGTTGRCPKCKTKFTVPQLEPVSANGHREPLIEKGRSDSQGNPGSDLPESHPVESTHKPDHPVGKIVKHSEVIPFDINPTDTFPADDSHYDLDALGDELVPDPEEAPIPAATTDSLEDLDCPSIMVHHPLMPTRSVLLHAENNNPYDSATEPRKNDKFSSFSDRPERSTPRAIPVLPAFDPAKFLSSEQSDDDIDELNSSPRFELRDTKPIQVREEKPAPRREEKPDFSLPFDSDEQAERPAPRPSSRSNAAPKPVQPPPEKIDLATAAKMMKNAIRDNQAEEAHQRELDAKSGFDFGQIFREFGLKGVGILGGGILAAFVLYYAADRMFSSSLKLPKLGYVHGVVKLDGQPLSGATVNFSPAEVDLAGSKKERARTSIGVTDDKGQFRMMYLPAENIEGVAVGKCRVWVTHVGPKGRSDVPDEWTEGGMAIREVTAGRQKEAFEINMQTRPGARR